MTLRTALIGANGQLGTDLRLRLPGDVLALDLPEFDVTRPDQVRNALHDYRPNWVINCSPYKRGRVRKRAAESSP